ncbi:hypothetical protein ACFV20_08010 [Streptomyces sp. NPDC059696]|uniref:hypothetical protein n=1 Tax=Streptomyces sp. NPDC059696 TaxID=3346911 RepID=UPI0036AC9F61
MAATPPRRGFRRLLCLLCVAFLLASCQSGPDDDRPGPDVAAARWRQIPLPELPPAFFGVTARSLVASKDGFLLAVSPGGGGAELYRSEDGISWRSSRPSAEQMKADVLAAHDGDVIAAGRLFRDGEELPATMPYRGEGRWGKAEPLPEGEASNVVLAAARGPRGAVVVSHTGGPFDTVTDQKRGRSLRVWTSKGSASFRAPYDVSCPQWPDQEPEVGALAGEEDFTVWAKCADAFGTSASFTLKSSDGETWRRTSEPPAPLAARAGTSRPSAGARVGQVLAVPHGYAALGSTETPARLTGALWSSADGRRWTEATSGKDGFRQSVRVDAAAEYDGTLLAFGTDPEPDGHPPARTRVWIGTPPGHAPKRIPTKGEGLRAVTGTWSWAQGTLKVTEQGEFTYRYRVLRDCATDAPPCDDVTTSTWGGLVTGTVKEGPRGTLRGTVRSANATDRGHAPGDRVTLTREPYSAVGLTIGDSVVGVFCHPGSYDERCQDVHG